MIDYPTFMQIKHLHQEQHLKCSQIAKELSLDERTVANWLSENQYHQRKPVQRSSKLDPFKGDIMPSRIGQRYLTTTLP